MSKPLPYLATKAAASAGGNLSLWHSFTAAQRAIVNCLPVSVGRADGRACSQARDQRPLSRVRQAATAGEGIGVTEVEVRVREEVAVG